MRYLATLLAAVLVAFSAAADPGAGQWINAQSLNADETVNHPDTLLYAITSSAESKIVDVTTPKADLCFDPNLNATGGAARISAYRIITKTNATIAGSILLPSIPIDNSDCIVLVQGSYWVEVTTGPAGGEAPIVSITGRSN